MNPWDIDPNLSISLWKLLRTWYAGRKARKEAVVRGAGCRA